MKVADEIKAQYKSNSVHKNLIVRFPELNVQTEHKNLHQNSMRLKESLFDKDSIEFVGCIASIFQIDIEMLSDDVKGKRIEVEIYTDAYPNSPISLFHGIVDSALKQANSRTKEIVAYDELYTKGNINVVPWYKSLGFPITLKEVRDSLFDYIGLAQEPAELPCDSVQIKKQYKPSSLQAVSVIKAICQINGVFGIINRQGRFEYRIPSNTAAQSITAPYPSTTLFPSGILFPAGAAQEAGETARLAEKMHVESFSFYKSVSHEEFVVRPVDMVTIRNSEDSEGVSYKGSDSAGINNYIIQGNMFTYGLTDDVLLEIAEKIYRNVSGFEYMPFQTDNNGLPYIECGLDTVDYIMIDYDKSTGGDIVYKRKAFHVLDRELTGIQALRDNYSARGEEYQTEFITDLQTQIDLLKKKNSQEAQETQQQMEDYTYSREEIDQKFDSGGSKWDVASVPVLPTTIAANTMYLIQGEVVVEVMGRQSARLYFQGKDHKDIYFNGHYHDQMYLSDGEGNATLVWEKVKEPVEPPKEGIFNFLIMPVGTFKVLVQGSVHIDWGDGESSDFEDIGTLRGCSHSYTKTAKFMVQIRGDIQDIRFQGGYDYLQDDLIEVLTKLPKTMAKITQIDGLFIGNMNLERIPAGLFDNCPNIKKLDYTFSRCSSLECIPAGLFDNCPNAESFQSTFNGCSNIKEIPKGLFKNCPEAVRFQHTFSDCRGLASIPSDIFADSINMSDFAWAFSNCSNLTYIPSGLFDGRPNVESFERTFSKCRNVVSNVPELWKTHTSTKKYGACFNGCDKAENFKNIPWSWYYE